MDAREALGLLSRWAIDDRREVNAAIARSWADRFHDTPAYLVHDAAERVLENGAYIDQQAVKKELRTMQPRLEADVRSARLRGLIGKEWPKDKPLDPATLDRLRELQRREFEATNDYPDQISGGGTFGAIE